MAENKNSKGGGEAKSTGSIYSVRLGHFPDYIHCRPRSAGGAEAVAVACSTTAADIWNGELLVLDVATGRTLLTLPTPGGNTCVQWAGANVALLVSAGDDGSAHIWNVDAAMGQPKQQQQQQSQSQSKKRTRGAKRGGKGKRGGSGGGGGGSPVVDDEQETTTENQTEEQEVSQAVAHLSDHSDIISSISIHDIQTNYLLTASWDRSVKLWDLNKPVSPVSTFSSLHSQEINVVEWHPAAASASSSSSPSSSSSSSALNQTFLTASRDQTVCIWDATSNNNGTPIASCVVDAPVFAAAWNPYQPTVFAAGSESGLVSIFDMRNISKPISTNSDHKATVRSLHYSPYIIDVMATGSDDGTAHILHTNSNRTDTVASYAMHSDYVRAVAWTTTRKDRLFVGSWDKSISLNTAIIPSSASEAPQPSSTSTSASSSASTPMSDS